LKPPENGCYSLNKNDVIIISKKYFFENELMFNFGKTKYMKRNKISLAFTCFLISACIIIMSSCKKEQHAAIVTPTPIVSFTVDDTVFTANSVSITTIQSYTSIKAIYTTSTRVQEIIIELSSNATGTYSLNNYNSTSSIGAAYFSGASTASLTGYETLGVSPYVGTMTITSSVNNVVSGTFSFTGTCGGATYSVSNGSFTNVTL
jgi:hypothetical protein